VEYDDEGAPKYYFILRQHPGESIIAAVRRDDYEQVEAFNPNGTRKVVHLFDPVRPEQTRGYSAFGPGLLDAQDLDRYREAEKYGAIMAASHVATIQTENPQAFAGAFAQAAATDTGADGEEYTRREFVFAPGATFVGKPGEKIDFNTPSRPSSAFSEYSYDLLQGPANALDIPPEVFAQRWAGLNYSNARTILIQFYASCWIRQGLLINHLCAPIYANVVAAAVAAGLLPASHYGRRTPELLAASWVPMVYRRWIDPAKESAGRETDLRSNVETLTDTLTELGKDPDEHLEQRARELRRIKDLEEKYGVTFPGLGAGAKEQNDGGKDEAGDDDARAAGRPVFQVVRP
jgi:lambda family phage portal protein